MKKLIVLIVGLLGCALLAIGLNPSITYITNEGYVIETGQNISSALSQSSGSSITLHKLEEDAMIYSSFFSDYDYNSKVAIDMSYPMYTHNGATLSFFNNEYSLVSDEFQILDTYQGLYLSDGNTYNEDLSQADADDFFFVALNNGLYMNAQTAVFKNQLYETTIPLNSIIQFKDTDVRFYSYVNGQLEYTTIEEVYGSTITIGENTFDYMDFLEALGLLSDAIALKEDGGDYQKVIDEILDILDIDDDDAGDFKKDSTDDSESDTSDAEDGTDSTDGEDAPPVDLEAGNADDNGSNQKPPSAPEDHEGSQDNEEDLGSSDPEDSFEGDGPDTEGEQADGEGGGIEGSQDDESPEREYEEPTVAISNLDDWAYAIHGDLMIIDNSGTIRKGVAVTVYGKITGVGSATVNDEGVKVYDNSDYVGSSAKMRKTYYSGQEFTLSGLEPDTELYVQYTYSYSLETVDEETGVESYTTKFVTSDFYTVRTQTIEDGELPTIDLSYNAQFASYSDRMVLENLFVKNDSDYVVPELGYEGVDFDNFKLNVLPYISKLIFTFENDEPIVVTSSTIKKAMEEGGTLFTSNVASLASNAAHKYTVTAEDKYGNELNLRVNGEELCTGTVYTAKTQPTITIDEVENITDKLTISVTVNDVDQAITTEGGIPKDLKLMVTNTAGEPMYLSGSWKDGTAFTSDSNSAVSLPEPTDGKTYTMQLDTLAFARTYTFNVYGDYSPQPDVTTNLTVIDQPNVLFGSDKIYTAAITSGTIHVQTENIKVLDTGAELGFTIDSDTDIEVLPLIDELRIGITDSSNNKLTSSVVIKESELSQHSVGDEGYIYNTDTGSVVIMTEQGLTVELVASLEELQGKTFWEAMMIQTYTVDNGDGTTTEMQTKPAQLKVNVATGTFATSTTHIMSYEAVVIKSGVEYTIPIIMSNSKFTTKKLDPIVTMDDSFIANDIIEFINFDVTDVDGTVTGDGIVEVRLYKGDALLQKARVYVAADPANVRFEKLITGIEYKIDVVALAYNNDTGYASYKSEYTLESYVIEAGSDIKATIDLNYLEYIYNNRSSDAIYSMTGEECAEEISKTDADGYSSAYDRWSIISTTATDGRYSNFIDITQIAAGYDGIELEYQPNSNTTINPLLYSSSYMTFYDADHKFINEGYVPYVYGATLAGIIPDGAKYVRLRFGDIDYLSTWGFKLYGFNLENDTPIVALYANDTDDSQAVLNTDGAIVANSITSTPSTGTYTTNSSYRTVDKLAVTPGDVYIYTGYLADSSTKYTSTSHYSYIYLYNKDGVCVGYENGWTRSTKYTVPENIYYISFCTSYSYNFALYKVASTEGSTGTGVQYEMSADISVYDKNKYLLDASGNSTVTVVLEQSDVINADDDDYTKVKDSSGRIIEMSPGVDGYYGYEQFLDYLKPNCSYRLSIEAVFQGADITLASETFNTDGAYIIINDEGDFSKIYKNRYSNFLVMNDLTIDNSYDITFYGTIDFNGHTVTKNTNSTLISTIGKGGVLKNLVYENNSGYVIQMISNNYGTVENVLLRTVGNVETNTTSRSLLVYNNFGTIQNFIIELGGDVKVNHSYFGMVSRVNISGIIQDGYVYTTNSGALIYKDEITYTGGVVGETYTGSTTQNIYSTFDTYMVNTENMWSSLYGYALISCDRSNSTNSMYHIGDFYEYENDKKSSTPMEEWAIYRDAISSVGTKNIWSIANGTYDTYSSYDQTQIGTISMLSDLTWQKEILGDAFDIDGSVSMGYYPRLDLPTCMQQHQEYRTLPNETQSNIPNIVSDGFTEGSSIYNTSGTVTLRFENPQEYQIKQVDIASLSTTVTEQSIGEDGLYDVVLTVSVSSDTKDEAYLSAYEVTGFQYSNGGMLKEVTVDDYTTSNIAFYKPVASVAEWSDINNHMEWNYRLTHDIEFSGDEPPGAIMINGSTSNQNSTATFKGIIDGGNHKLIGLELNNVDKPYVIYYLYETAAIKNLYIEDLVIDGKTNIASDYAGFVRQSSRGTVINNVHMSNATIKAAGTIGALIGYSRGQITDSTFNNINITLESKTYDVRIGGVAGGLEYGYVANCYARDVNIKAQETSTVTGIGGFAGYSNISGMYDCYVQGNINTDGKNVGGVIGYADHVYGNIQNTYSDVDIDTISDNVGGIAGMNENRTDSNLALGQIFAGSSYVNRVVGFYVEYKNYYYPNYAYKDQTVNDMASEDVGDAVRLLSSEELKLKENWVDVMSFNAQWDYSALSKGEMPKLYYQNSDVLLPGQDTGVAIPGEESISLTVNTAAIDKNKKTYTVDVTLADANSDYDALVKKIQAGDITFTIEGMAMTEDKYVSLPDEIDSQQGEWSYTLAPDTYGGAKVRIQITTSQYTQAFDNYRMTVTEGTSTLTAIVNYGESLYHEVPDRSTWDELMEARDDSTGDYLHARSVENFKITGQIDFEDGAPSVTNLMLGKLEGSGDAGFSNLYYSTTEELGGCWITSCKNIVGIDFTNITANFDSVPAYQSMATLIGNVGGDFTDLSITNLSIDGNNSYNGSLGLCYQITGTVADITIEKVNIKSDKTSTSVRSYAGTIAAYLYGGYTRIVGNDITIDCSYNNYTGGLFGFAKGNTVDTSSMVTADDIKLTEITAKGYSQVGAMVGYGESGFQLNGVSVDDADIEATGHAGGVAGGMTFSSLGSNAGYTNKNVSVTNSSVVTLGDTANSAYRTGGVFGFMYFYGTYYNLSAENVTVSGTRYVGGITGAYDGPGIVGAEVLNCSLTQYNSISASDSTVCVGGVAGYWYRDNTTVKDIVIRDTQIAGDYNAGGIVGYAVASYRSNIRNAYVAEDVTITANKNAGGIFGRAARFYIYDVAVGAEIVARDSNAGGIIGYIPFEDFTEQYIKGAYVRGSVTALDNTAGIVGYAEEGIALTSNKLSGVIVAADLNSQKAVDVVGNYQRNTVYQSGNISAWDNLLINGQPLYTLYQDEDTVTPDGGTALDSLPEGVKFCDADDFLLTTFYEKYGFEDYDETYLAADAESVTEDMKNNIYMPFITCDGTATIIPNSNSYNGVDEGILRPAPGVNPSATVVYASGIDTLNIETKQESVSITVNSVNNGKLYEYTFIDSDKRGDTYNVITIPYDFESGITVDGVTYTADKFANTVMTYGSMWYYIADSSGNASTTSLYFGGDKSNVESEDGTVLDPIHLWQGKALTEDGKIYYYNAGWKEYTPDAGAVLDADGNDIYDIAVPLYDYAARDVFYNFTIESDSSYYPYRILSIGASSYNVFVNQGTLYDAFILSDKVTYKYFALVEEETGRFMNYLANIDTSNFITTGIVEMSNTFDYTANCLVTKYETGAISVVNFSTGAGIIDKAPTDMGDFAAYTLSGLANSFFGDHVTNDDSYLLNQNLMGTYESNGGIATDSDNREVGEGEQEEAKGDSALTLPDADADADNDEDEVLDTNSEQAIGNTDSMETSGEDTEVAEPQDGETTDDTETGVEVNGTNSLNGDIVSSDVETDSSQEDVQAVGAGGIIDGEDTEGDATGSNGASNKTGDGAGDEISSTSNELEMENAEESPYTIAYNPYTGQYETYSTSDISTSGTTLAASQNTAMKQAIEEAQAETTIDDGEFVINTVTTNIWTDDERNGFMLLMIIGVMCIGVVVTMNIKMRKNRK